MAALIAVNIFFGAGIPILKSVLGHLPPIGWVFLRALCTALILLAWHFRQISRPPIRTVVWLIVAAFLGVMINQVCFAEGLSRTISPHAGIINATIPLFTLLFGWLFLQEPVGPRKILGILLGLGGVLYLLRVDSLGSFNPFFIGDLYIWMNVIGYSLFLIVSRQFVMKMMNPGIALSYIAAIGCLGIGWYSGWNLPIQKALDAPLKIQMFMIYLIVFPSIISYALNLWALKRVESSEAALYIYIQPVIATILGYWMTGDVPDHRFWVSSLFVAAGILVSSLK